MRLITQSSSVNRNSVMKACAVFLLSAATAIALPAQTTTGVPLAQTVTFTTLYSFCTADKPIGCGKGAYPAAALIQGEDGNFYGTASEGGGTGGDGAVFKIMPSGTLTKLQSFDGTDGDGPGAALVQSTDGNFYGTTLYGGNDGCGNPDDCGTVFKITPSGVLTTIHNFCMQSGCPDGAYPAGLVQATDGNFYGTTSGGGVNHGGTVFKITQGGTLTTIYSFCSQSSSCCTDGDGPEAALVQGTDGDFYGTTIAGGIRGGSCTNPYGCGTVFKITPGGTLTTLHRFNATDGAVPKAALLQATNGDFYGTTYNGGANGDCGKQGEGVGCGTVFKINSSGVLRTLYSFCSIKHCTDGSYPVASLAQATDGNFYGTTEFGGTRRHGTAFKLTPRGALTTLHDFCSQGYPCTDGSFPVAGLIQATDGNLYGTAEEGATRSHACHYGCGTIFRVNVGLK
jgi:uncharacterized repeat protein (TIGR03803 family)